MKILIISPFIPNEKSGGSGIKLLFTVKTLKKVCSDITLISFFNTEEELSTLKKETESLNINCIPFQKDFKFSFFKFLFKKKYSYINRFYSNKIKQFLIKHKKKYDFFYLDTVFSANYIKYLNKDNLIVDFHNFHSDILKERIILNKFNLIFKLFVYSQYKKMLKFEKKILQSDKIKKIVTGRPKHFFNLKQTQEIIPMLDIPEKKSAKSFDLILFTGNFEWYPNIKALDYVINIARRMPDFKFIVAGKNIKKVKLKKSKNVELINNPENLDNLFNKAKYFICPVSCGSGINIKIIQALAAGCFVLAHPEAVRKVSIFKKYIFSCSFADEYVDKILNLNQKNSGNFIDLQVDFLKKVKQDEQNKLILSTDIIT
ncbi:MAG: glycosyltransferase [Candidatus Muiribacteriota bacterium]